MILGFAPDYYHTELEGYPVFAFVVHFEKNIEACCAADDISWSLCLILKYKLYNLFKTISNIYFINLNFTKLHM